MYVPEGEKTILHAYKSKYNLTRENQVILLMISDGEKWLIKNSYCLNCFHSFTSKKLLEKHMKICEDKDYCYIEMPKKR